MELQISMRGAYDALLLQPRHRFSATAERRVFPVPDFGEHEGFAIFHDEVHFTDEAIEIAFNRFETLSG